MNQCLGRDRISSTQQHGAEGIGTLKIGAHLIEIAIDFAVSGASSHGHDAHDLPITASEMEALSDSRLGEALLDGFAYHHFAPAGLKPPAGKNFQVVAHPDARGRDATESYIDAIRRVNARQIDDRDHLKGSQGLSGIRPCRSQLEFQILEVRLRNTAA